MKARHDKVLTDGSMVSVLGHVDQVVALALDAYRAAHPERIEARASTSQRSPNVPNIVLPGNRIRTTNPPVPPEGFLTGPSAG